MTRTEAPPATETAVELAGIGKRFRLYERPVDRLAGWIGLGGRKRDFWALRGIDLRVPAGRSLGIVGPNGAGKSTLLKIITGTLLATEGTYRVSGRVAALLELGTGFHPEFTGRQNIRINGQLLGLAPAEIAEREEEVIAFSELGAFIDQPLRTYSSGMVVRLGFSIASSVNPRVLIVDEALSVGDARFSQKCIRRMRAFREAGTTILFVSHDPSAVTTLCDEAVLLDSGRIVGRGDPAQVLEQYGELIAAQGTGNATLRVNWERPNPTDEATPADSANGRRYGTFQAILAEVRLLDHKDNPCALFSPGAPLRLHLRVLFLAPVSEPTIGILVRDRLGTDVFGTNTSRLKIATGTHAAGECLDCVIDLPVQLCDGDYTLTAAVHADESHVDGCYDWADRLAAFRVQSLGHPRAYGIARLEPEFRFDRHLGDKSMENGLLAAFPVLPPLLRPAGISGASPFLSGFYPPERNAEGVSYAWAGREAHLVLAPRGGRLVLAAGRPPRVSAQPTTLRVETHDGRLLGEVPLEEDYSVVELPLPSNAPEHRMLLRITADPAHHEQATAHWPAGRDLAVALYAATTLQADEALPSWRELTAAS